MTLAELDNYSSVVELVTPINNNGGYTLSKGEPFGPQTPIWTYIPKDTFSFYAPFISSTHRLENGNTFVNSGPRGRFFEVTPEGNIVWEYLNPYFDDYKMPDGTSPQPVAFFFYAQYRIYHISADHPGLKGKDLKPIVPQKEVFTPPPPPEQGH